MTTRKRLVATTFALFMALTLAPSLVAQSSNAPSLNATLDEPAVEESVPPRWTAAFGEQARVLLQTGDIERQENAMMLILQYERRSDLAIDFQPAVPALFDIYEGSADDGHRLLALSTLQAIGGTPVLNRLAERLRENREASDRVKRHTIRVLAAYLQQDKAE